MQTMSAPCAKTQILWDLRLLATGRRMVEHVVLLTGAKWEPSESGCDVSAC